MRVALLIPLLWGVSQCQGLDKGSPPQLDGFPIWSSVVTKLQVAAASNPLVATYKSIGTTRGGRAIPSLELHFHDASVSKDRNGKKSGGVDLRPVSVMFSMVQPREALGMAALLNIMDRALEAASAASQPENDPVLAAIKHSRVVFIPILNPDGYEILRKNYPESKDAIVKNGASGLCRNESTTTHGVNLGHNWDFEWNYKIITSEDYTNPCDLSYRGPDPFSEPETRALRDLLIQENPKSVIIFHSRHISHESRILVPFMFHQSSFMQNNTKLQMLSDSDIAVYKNITSEMQAALPLKEHEYTVGTSWETIQHTISGSDLDWIFENTRAYSIILQLGTDEGSYWPSPELISGLIEKVRSWSVVFSS
ncbi:hypothetical protein BC830DRAFT_1170059 [Chytriomyces sp. MP71]|nr:hypothetical protein BC830DRAFT_1170059 [Chytriomyces sp. MP71]